MRICAKVNLYEQTPTQKLVGPGNVSEVGAGTKN